MSAPQCGHSTDAGWELTGAFAAFASGRFAGLFAGLDDSPSIALLSAVFVSAIFANTINLKSVASGHVMVLVPDLLFDLSNFLREKFDRRAALRTHHMMMIAPVVLMFVTRNAVVESYFAGQSAARKQLESSIDRREPDTRVSFLNQPVQFVDGKMFPGFEERPEDSVALPSLLQSDTLQMPKENPFCFADILPRDGRLVVDSFLQHVGRRGNSRMIMNPRVAIMILGESGLHQPPLLLSGKG